MNPIYLNFDMSEADYLTFKRERASQRSTLASTVEVSLSDENRFTRQGTLNFLDNTLDRASGTIHARATVANSDRLLTPGSFGRIRLTLTELWQVLLIPDAAVSADQTHPQGPGPWIGWRGQGEEGADRRSSLRFARLFTPAWPPRIKSSSAGRRSQREQR